MRTNPHQDAGPAAESGDGYLSSVQLLIERVADLEAYPFSLAAVQALRNCLPLDPGATFFVGDNGIGKSTIVEAIAIAAGFNPEGGTKNFSFSTRASESSLYRCIRIARTPNRPRTGFFFRAESFFNVASNIEALDQLPATGPRVVDSYGGRSLHEQSHGEAFMALVRNRFGSKGLYILDEPEASLSIAWQFELLRELHEHVAEKQSQLIIATHSPLLMALPRALIYRCDQSGISRVAYEQVDAVRLMRQFLKDPGKALLRTSRLPTPDTTSGT